MRKCFSDTMGLSTTMSQEGSRPTTVSVFWVRSKLEPPRFRVIFFTEEILTVSPRFSPVLRMTMSLSNLTTGRLKRLPPVSTSDLYPSGVRSSTYHTLFFCMNRSCSGATKKPFTTTSQVRFEPTVNSFFSSLSKKLKSSPSLIFRIILLMRTPLFRILTQYKLFSDEKQAETRPYAAAETRILRRARRSPPPTAARTVFF